MFGKQKQIRNTTRSVSHFRVDHRHRIQVFCVPVSEEYVRVLDPWLLNAIMTTMF